jgi:hypothetical protein
VGLRAEAPIVAAIIITLVLVVGLALYVIHLNQEGAISFGKDVPLVAAVSFSSTYGKRARVGLSNGLVAEVNWDGKAVAVVGVGGEYARVKNVEYFVWVSWGKGTRSSSGCPFYSFITGATRYGVRILSAGATEIGESGPAYVTIKYSPSVASALKAHGISVTIVNVGSKLYIRFPIYAEKWLLKVNAQFLYGHSGVFGGCPSMHPVHTGSATTTGSIPVIGP